jgi:hypothetical protein
MKKGVVCQHFRLLALWEIFKNHKEELNAELDTVYRKGTLGMNRFFQISYVRNS